jgi:hypothetical protein
MLSEKFDSAIDFEKIDFPIGWTEREARRTAAS